LSGAEADHVAQVVMDVLANRIDTPDDGFDPRTEVEAHAGGDLEQLIAAWEADQAEWRKRVEELERERDEARTAARTYLHNGAAAIEARAWEQHRLEVENQRLREESDRRWVGWRSACARATEARECERMERWFAREFSGDVIRLRREMSTTAAIGREEGRREGMAELVAHLENVAAGARAGKAEAYTEEADFWGPTRWCLITDQAHKLAEAYTAGKGLPVPDATARAKALEEEMRWEQGRHATEVVRLREEARRWRTRYESRERWACQLQTELHEVRTTTRRRELVLADRLRRRGERLRRAQTRYVLSELGANHTNELLDLATRFEVGPVTVTPHGEGWRCSWPAPDWPGLPGQGPTLTEDHPDRFDALVRASQISAQTPADAALR